MKNVCVGFEQQNKPFCCYTCGMNPEENISFTTTTKFNDNKTTLKTKYALIHPAEGKEGSITPKTEISLDQKLGERVNTTIITTPTETSAKFLVKVLNKEKHKMELLPMYKQMKVQNADDKSLFDIVMKYNYSNKIMTSFGLLNLSKENSYAPALYSFSYVQGKELANEKIINGGLKMEYDPKKQGTKTINLFASLRNPHFNSLLGLELLKQTAESEESISESPKLGYDKKLYLKMCNKFNEKWCFGGESVLPFATKKPETKLYAKYQVDPETIVKAQWNDKDYSFTIRFTHLFRKFFKTGLTYKIIPEEVSKKGGFGVKTKFGFSAEIQES